MASNAAAIPPPEPQLDRRTQLILTISRVWAWVFLAGLVAFFWISVSYSTDGEVNFLSLRNIMNVLVAITPVLLMGSGPDVRHHLRRHRPLGRVGHGPRVGGRRVRGP